MSAFPKLVLNWNPSAELLEYALEGGLTKREYFAGLAMQGILAGRSNPYYQGDDYARGSVATSALMYADALLAELAK